MTDFANYRKAVEKFKNEVVRRAKLNLGVTRRRISRRSTWKKTGSRWIPTSTKIKYKKGRSVASGKLQSSIRGKVNRKLNVEIYYESYGDFVQQGRRPKGNKMAPPKKIYQWTKMKRMRIQDIEKGGFKKESESARKGMAFAINRSINYFGIEPYPFLDMAVEETMKKEMKNLTEAWKKDMIDGINNK